MINEEVIQLTILRAKGRRRGASDLCVFQFMWRFVDTPPSVIPMR